MTSPSLAKLRASPWRLTLVYLLVATSFCLGGLNLVKHGVVTLPDGSDDRDQPVEEAALGASADDQADGSVGAPTPDVATRSGDEAGDDAREDSVDAAAGSGATGSGEADEWPGGRGPVPEGPPEPWRAVLSPDGEVVLTGSAPDWATVREIVYAAAEKLPGGPGVIVNRMTWHPDADPSIRWGDVVMEEAATFQLASTEIDSRSLVGLDLAAQIMIDHPSVFAVVVGHTDGRGDPAVNSQVAIERARAVVDYLEAHGVDAGRILVASPGEEEPVGSSDSGDDGQAEDGGVENRRVEIRFENLLIDFGSG